ncbi:MAG: GNAT family N-acetyltransferase [Salinibacterium sp.]|nr:GNAT family N-acetyltransferase [Salinibacterium sp.]
MTPWEYEPIHTERLLLRLMVDSDLPDVYDWMSDEAVTRYQLYDTRSHEQVQEHIDKVKVARRLEKDDDFIEFAIVLRGSDGDRDRVIGALYFVLKSAENESAELGWALTAKYQGQGYAFEAAAAVRDLAFTSLGLHRVTAELDPRNLRSVALCVKLGMRREAHYVEDLMFKGSWADTGVYAMLEREWRAL